MPFDRTVPPYRLSPADWNRGYDEVDLAIAIHDNGDGTAEQDDRRDRRDALLDLLQGMNADQLRAYIDGMHSRLGEYLY